MNKFVFPTEQDKQPTPSIMDMPVRQAQALFLFFNATGESIRFALSSFELSFPNKDTITLRDVMEWIRAYYKNKEK